MSSDNADCFNKAPGIINIPVRRRFLTNKASCLPICGAIQVDS